MPIRLPATAVLFSVILLLSGCGKKYSSWEERTNEINGIISRVAIQMDKGDVREGLKHLDRTTRIITNPYEARDSFHYLTFFEFRYPKTIGPDSEEFTKTCSSSLRYYYHYFGNEKKFYEGKAGRLHPDQLIVYFDKHEKVIGWSYEITGWK